MNNDKPEFGYGKGRRPLWTVRDRDAERIRGVLRKAGHREWSLRHGGFTVEGGQAGAPFLIACADDWAVSAAELSRYATALLAAGYQAVPDPDDDQVLQAWQLPGPRLEAAPGSCAAAAWPGAERQGQSCPGPAQRCRQAQSQPRERPRWPWAWLVDRRARGGAAGHCPGIPEAAPDRGLPAV